MTRLTEGEVLPLDAAAYFEGAGLTYTARSSNTGVAAVEVYGSSVLVAAVAVGGATVTVTAANGSGSAEQDFVVVVSPRAPRAAGSMADQTLIAGGAALETDLPATSAERSRATARRRRRAACCTSGSRAGG